MTSRVLPRHARGVALGAALIAAVTVAGCSTKGTELLGDCPIQPGADCPGNYMRRANLTGAQIPASNFARADLTKVQLTGADMIGATFQNANLTGADLGHGMLTYANLIGADLTGVNLVGADLRGANLTGAKVTGAQLLFTLQCRTTMPDATVSMRNCPSV
jgi:uncharacterized protein YjbI with pentapeptide repeats